MKEYIFMSRFVIEKLFSFCVHSCTAGRLLNVEITFLNHVLSFLI